MKNKALIMRVGAILLVALVLISAAAVGGVYSRYASKSSGGSSLAEAEDFYFECSFEDDGLYLYPAERDFLMEISNFNAFDGVSSSDISYTVSVDGVEVYASSLEGGTKTSEHVNISSANLILGEKHKVNVTSSKPFWKTIEFDIFVVDDTIDNFYTVKKESNWIKLDLYIGTTPPEALTVLYGGELAPDNTHTLMRDWRTDDRQVTISGSELHPYTHYELIFFGASDASDISVQTPITDGMTIDIQ